MLMAMQEKEGRGFSFAESMIVCQPLLSVHTSIADDVHKLSAESDQCTANDEPEPMRISLDFAKSDTGDEMPALEELNSDFDSLAITGAGQVASSS